MASICLPAAARPVISATASGVSTRTVALSPAASAPNTTVAVAEKLLRGGSYVDCFHSYFHAYPHAGYGATFIQWALRRDRAPYNSWGNGSAMRVGPVALALESFDEVLTEARASAEVTHNHSEGIKGAQATAAAIFLARRGASKAEIKAEIEDRFGYDLSRRLDDVRDGYSFDVSCQGSVPQSILAFLEAQDYEDALRNAISLGGDADTMACIAGGIAEAFFGGVPEGIRNSTIARLDQHLAMIIAEFANRFMPLRP